ncbi:MAG TPA: hypothetical protein VG711_02475 [Phycisphaerales bacterium]|nr:hypothetical protein [Phycisphaerales bacterium]
MPANRNRYALVALSAVGALVCAVGAERADAGVVMSISVNNVAVVTNAALGGPVGGPPIFTYDPDFTQAGVFKLTGDVNMVNIGNTHGMNTPVSIENLSGGTLNFVITFVGDLTFNPGNTLNWTDSSSWSLGGPDGQTLTTLGFNNPGPDGDSLWTAMADGVDVNAIWDDPTGLSGSGSSLGVSSENGTIAAINSSIGIRLSFSLSAGGIATVSGGFMLTPAPGAMALLGMAGLVKNRRRRA